MSYLDQPYSDGAKLTVWNNLLSDDSVEQSPPDYSSKNRRQLVHVVAGTLGVLVYSQGMFEPPLDVRHGEYDLNVWSNAASTIPTLRGSVFTEPVSISDIVDLSKKTFGLSAVQLAEILKISRPSLYNHIAGKETPIDISPYMALYSVASIVAESVDVSLRPGLKSMLIEGKTLLGHLKDSYKDVDLIKRISIVIAEKLSERGDKPPSISLSEQRKAVIDIGKSG